MNELALKVKMKKMMKYKKERICVSPNEKSFLLYFRNVTKRDRVWMNLQEVHRYALIYEKKIVESKLICTCKT